MTPAAAWAIIRRLPPLVETVGVFVNWSVSAVEALARAVRLHAAQLHGDESPEMVRDLARSCTVIKAFRVGPPFRASALARYPAASAFLLDGFRPRFWGGTGKTWDWQMARRAGRYGRIILAGGLRPENVAQAIAEARPYAIDVCSGIESRPGRKDPRRLRALMEAVEQANRARK